MDHGEATRLMATEKYLLNELTPELRDEYEEHFFGCMECAADLRAGAALLEYSKSILSKTSETHTAAIVASPKPVPSWLAWLRPAFAAPALAVLLAVVAYQNLATFPKLRESAASVQTPQLLPAVSLMANVRGGNAQVISLPRNKPFLLYVDVPPAQNSQVSYLAELQDPEGNVEWSLPVPNEAARDTVSLRVPPVHGKAGNYTLVVSSTGGDKGKEVVARYPFELRFQ